MIPRATLAATLFVAVPVLTPTAKAIPISSVELDMFDAINAARTSAGLDALLARDDLSADARSHSNDMATVRCLNHTRTDGSSVNQRVGATGHSSLFYPSEVLGMQLGFAGHLSDKRTHPMAVQLTSFVKEEGKLQC
jgi:hypothetical protein